MLFSCRTEPSTPEQEQAFVAGEYRPRANPVRAELVREAYAAIGGEQLGPLEKCFDTALGPLSVAFFENAGAEPYLRISIDPGNPGSSRVLVGFLDGAFILRGRPIRHRVDSLLKALYDEARRCNETRSADVTESLWLHSL